MILLWETVIISFLSYSEFISSIFIRGTTLHFWKNGSVPQIEIWVLTILATFFMSICHHSHNWHLIGFLSEPGKYPFNRYVWCRHSSRGCGSKCTQNRQSPSFHKKNISLPPGSKCYHEKWSWMSGQSMLMEWEWTVCCNSKLGSCHWENNVWGKTWWRSGNESDKYLENDHWTQGEH